MVWAPVYVWRQFKGFSRCLVSDSEGLLFALRVRKAIRIQGRPKVELPQDAAAATQRPGRKIGRAHV